MLTLVCGIPGSGKSTVVAKLVEADPFTIVLSSDVLRAVLGKDEEDQSVTPLVFITIRNMVRYFLRQGKKVIVDATNISIKNRKEVLDIARALNVVTKAVVLDVPLEVAKQRNAARARVVPEWVIDKMHREFVVPVKGEFDEVEYWTESGNFEYVKTS